MPDAIFAHPRLAAIYDTFDGDRADLPHYLAIADELAAHRVLDIGCGTGTLAIALARTGRTVLGVDPAAASLAVAATKLRQTTGITGSVHWLHGHTGAIPAAAAETAFDLATMTGNVAQVFLTDHEWIQTLRHIHTALRAGGHLVFETRRPEHRAWLRWANATPVTRELPGIGAVEQHLQVLHVDLPLVTFRYTYRFHTDGTVLTSDSTLRFRNPDGIEADLTATGYELVDIREAPDRPGREHVFLARASAPP